ncbi:hypothetical protein [Pseudomonas sp.]|uniref:hypothetical protein n=1 Tax=Pseudomonas sp. TaxID=306 RepID=UPI003D14E93E
MSNLERFSSIIDGKSRKILPSAGSPPGYRLVAMWAGGKSSYADFPSCQIGLTRLPATQQAGLKANKGPFTWIETVDPQFAELGNSNVALCWQEKGGATAMNLQLCVGA